MTCDVVRNKLLAEVHPSRVPAELRPHVSACAGCREFLVRFESLTQQIHALDVPSSELAKIALIDQLEQAGPMHRSVPATPAGAFSWKDLLARAAKPLVGIAAAVAVGLGIWAVSGSRKAVPEVVAVRHDLLKRVVATNATLARTSDAKARIVTLSDLAADIRSEASAVMNASPEDDLASLAGMYEKVIRDGLVVQAKQLNRLTVSPKDRLAILTAAADRLAATADEASAQAASAPPQAKVPLARIEQAAQQGRIQLQRIATGEGA